MLKKIQKPNNPSEPIHLFGLTFKNRVGLAAGFDKDARWLNSMNDLGFGCIEIGTLTPKGQTGNPKPRLFRLKNEQALINRMGFNNKGVHSAIERLKNRPKDLIIGGNIGKNTDTPLEHAIEDYLYCFKQLHPYVDYITVNVSCPNVGSLKELSSIHFLKQLLPVVIEKNNSINSPKPILLKISPELSNTELDDVISLSTELGIHGIIATNTRTDRACLTTPADTLSKIGAGGISGQPIYQKTKETVAYIHQKTKGALPIIAVGGVFCQKDARELLIAGASLIQIYTGFIYKGPSLVKDLAIQFDL